ncbi:MAG: hypothetical protein M1339_02385, partial [Bacteroidetes bacterium]|nr:hypothetical protein [Bacteroidota bacterium]
MIDFKKYEIWFATGSQHLYGPDTLKQVDDDSERIVQGLTTAGILPVP